MKAYTPPQPMELNPAANSVLGYTEAQLRAALQEVTAERDAYQVAADDLARELKALQYQEPVAWMYDWYTAADESDSGDEVCGWLTTNYEEAHSPTMGCHNIRPLYTHPAAPQPAQPVAQPIAQPACYVNGDELSNMLDDRTATVQTAMSGYRGTPLYTAAQPVAQPTQEKGNEMIELLVTALHFIPASEKDLSTDMQAMAHDLRTHVLAQSAQDWKKEPEYVPPLVKWAQSAQPVAQPPSGELTKLFNWKPSYSKTQPDSILLQELTIHHPDGQSQTLFAGPTYTHYYTKNDLEEAYKAGKDDREAVPVWLPIETAPQDFVTTFDGWNGERVADVIWGHPEYSPKGYRAWCISEYTNGRGWGHVEVKGLTHWMPLPPAPSHGIGVKI